MMSQHDHPILKLEQFWELKEARRKAAYKYEFLLPHQEFVRRYMSRFYRTERLLLQHTTGSGKTLTATAVCEDMRGINAKCLVLVKGNLSADNFKQRIKDFHRLSGSEMSDEEI